MTWMDLAYSLLEPTQGRVPMLPTRPIIHSIRWRKDRQTWLPQITIHCQNTIKYSEKGGKTYTSQHSEKLAYRSRCKHFVTAINHSFHFKKGH